MIMCKTQLTADLIYHKQFHLPMSHSWNLNHCGGNRENILASELHSHGTLEINMPRLSTEMSQSSNKMQNYYYERVSL